MQNGRSYLLKYSVLALLGRLYAIWEYTPNKNSNTANGNSDKFTAERIKSQDSIWQTSNIINAQSSSIATQAVYESKWDSSGQSLKMIVAYSKSRNNSFKFKKRTEQHKINHNHF